MGPDETNAVTRILVVEDEAIIARDLARRLEKLGYEVVGIADNGADALAQAAEQKPTLVFMDIVIQGPIDGIETAAQLLRQTDVPVVFLTAHADAATIHRAKQVGPYGYLVKPFEERELHTTIEMALYRHESEAQARLLHHAIKNAGTGIVVADARRPQPLITLCNPAFERLTGYAKAEVIGRHPSFIEGPDTDPEASAEVRRALEEQRDCQVTLTAHRKDGQPFWNDLTLSTVRDAAGEVTHFLFLHTDITARKKAEDALHHAQKMQALGQLTGGIAHDFNNILAVILGFAGFVRDTLPEGDARRDDMMEVLGATEKGADLTRQLLTFSRRQPVARRPLEMNGHVAGLLKMLRRSVGAHIGVEVVPSVRPAIVRMDPTQVDQVLLNLAANARDAMPDGGRLRVTIAHAADRGGPFPEGRCVRLVATDTGCGMNQATLSRVFEPLFTTKDVGKGTGLGLATCDTIVTDAGGTIRVESEPGQGTTFTIDLPVCDEPVEDALEHLSPSPRATGERVLVVEDDAALRKVAARIFESAGYQVVQAQNGDEAIRRLDDVGRDVDLIFTDIIMPGRGGYAVVEHAKTRAPNARVLLTSGYVGDTPETGDGGDASLLWKPYTSSSLLRAAHGALNPERDIGAVGEHPAAACGAVLLIEDHVPMRTVIRRALVGAGYDVESADSVAAARSALGADRDGAGRDYAAILCDLTLPDGSGADLVQWLREARPALARRTLVLTGGALDEAGRRFLANGVTEVLRKPIDPKRLLERVAAVANRDAPEETDSRATRRAIARAKGVTS